LGSFGAFFVGCQFGGWVRSGHFSSAVSLVVGFVRRIFMGFQFGDWVRSAHFAHPPRASGFVS
jgi:hypothetical protein